MANSRAQLSWLFVLFLAWTTTTARPLVAFQGTGSQAGAESDLLALANRSRKEAGLEPLQMDPGLTRAARKHAELMAERQQLSHQFSGEPALAQRLATASDVFFDEAGENVGLANSAGQSHEGFMHSKPHRENLLHPSYNVAGIGVVRRGNTLYVVEDFAHRPASHSAGEVPDLIGKSIAELRQKSKLPALARREATTAKEAACALGKQDSLRAEPWPQTSPPARAILRYTSLNPEILPAGADKVIKNSALGGYAVGTCFQRTKSYPSGVYWIVLVFY